MKINQNNLKQVRPLKIAILGTRGVPASYGGFETLAEELGSRLVENAHQVSVFGRKGFLERKPDHCYRGIRVRLIPTIKHKYLETPVHGLFSFLALLFERFDVVLLCNAANSPFAWLARLRSIPVAINVDGIERFRTKWNLLGRMWYRLGELCSVLFASRIVSDAHVIRRYYLEQYGAESAFIAYGAAPKLRAPGEVLRELGLRPGEYLLYVSRLEPENNALGVIKAYKQARIPMPLVVVGDAPYAKSYIRELQKEASGSEVVFAGYRFNEAYQELRSNCYLYIQATEVGGTHPALVEAMAYGNAIIANDVPEHREVLQDAGAYYARNNFDQLADRIRELVCSPILARELGDRARFLAASSYDWRQIVESYQQLFVDLAEHQA